MFGSLVDNDVANKPYCINRRWRWWHQAILFSPWTYVCAAYRKYNQNRVILNYQTLILERSLHATSTGMKRVQIPSSGAFLSTDKHPLHWCNFFSFGLQAEGGLWADNKYLEVSYSCPKFAPFLYSISMLCVKRIIFLLRLASASLSFFISSPVTL